MRQTTELSITIISLLKQRMGLPVDVRGTNAPRGKGKLQKVLHKRENRLSLHKLTQLMTKARLFLVAGVAGMGAVAFNQANGAHRATTQATTQAITQARSQWEMPRRGQMVGIMIREPVRAVS
jgi:hypothetical protein